MDAVEDARERIAVALGAEDPSQILFTSGATESNNWIAHFYTTGLVMSPFEHSSMREAGLFYGAEELKSNGYTLVPQSADLQSIMLVNNETGAILTPLPDIPVHRDITQAVGKVPVDLSAMDYASLSAHKFGGPKGVGLLYASRTMSVRPFMHGGEHELGLRAGTLNVPGIVGMAKAAELAVSELPKSAQKYLSLREVILDELSELEAWGTDPICPRSPAIISLSFDGLEGETLTIELDAKGFAISSGAACSSRSQDPSHVLTSLEYPESRLRGTVRVSLGATNTLDSTVRMVRALRELVQTLRKDLGF